MSHPTDPLPPTFFKVVGLSAAPSYVDTTEEVVALVQSWAASQREHPGSTCIVSVLAMTEAEKAVLRG
jgi:hypothetical protein